MLCSANHISASSIGYSDNLAVQIEANGRRLCFDVEGAALVPDGPALCQRPTVVLLHGGPGSFDHSCVYGGDSASVTPEEWAPCWQLFGPWVPGADAGHFTWRDVPDRYWPLLLDFVNDAYLTGSR
jgi:pimeloyl-ACP methyl ester carboxylesterase